MIDTALVHGQRRVGRAAGRSRWPDRPGRPSQRPAGPHPRRPGRPGAGAATETDVLGRLHYLPARQADGDLFRLSEVAGTAHADRSLVGDFESVLGCDTPVNRGQQRFVVRAALRALVDWPDRPPVRAERLEVVDGPEGLPEYVLDMSGNVAGGVRTPCVDVPAEVLSGLAGPGANRVCMLFGRTLPIAEDTLRDRYPSRQHYLEAYRSATDAAIAAGFVLAEDHDGCRTAVRNS